ncbi:DUF192 domain-containing protein [Borreliella burgdorferi]|uniref:DUF192 domain-containing protein n=1 Tax=Borreliella burgdorferi TaxID=139 RepID=UPI00016B3B7E|nr:DUF192 domain-containing protein [Borreliella burgdorferi]AGS66662.1 hypothetical protein L144_03255 [Borreliella burgdorferi CA382]ADQ30734.1 conserved hypothetical protein [Borreliella burgdorferi JD1]ATH10197.1 DUF192 domain-containing protein [Borreliella burgdorferi]AXK70645.1 hypothetical protein BbuMM1_06450 [Borreliella burgdorferi]EEC21930.1 conserved hypothetical protein [Borreliella burgdorferi 156a]
MKKILKRFLFLVLSMSFLSFADHFYDKEIMINGVKFFVKIASNELDRAKGYMGAQKVEYGNGMLFVFKKDQNLSFWMENTPLLLEIAYIDSNGIIKEIYDLEPYSRANVNSLYKVRYALELPRGSFSKFQIKIGDKVHFCFDVNSLLVE